MITCNDERHRQHALLRRGRRRKGGSVNIGRTIAAMFQRPALGLCRALAKGRRSCRGVGEARCTFEQLTLGGVAC